ncbi:hypothetical protein CFOL_v3_18083 [Cephalotus follicularis]|uniref:Uncharacterized protein n=1 Tax=Cephalotus follicularis TaxID=3775 RepID=A0A1Q3C3I7_CEPFO|nr:hypothetical protein CFOL_v3_18083 [Cephalotus follicularis]
MWRILATMIRSMQNMKKSPRVGDENMVGGNNGAVYAGEINSRPRWNGISFICSVVRAPLSILSCVSQPHVNGAHMCVSNEFAQVPDMNHLMVSDSMRYAILM